MLPSAEARVKSSCPRPRAQTCCSRRPARPKSASNAAESYLLAQHAVADAVEACAMAVLHGGAGLGKTYAVEDVLAAPDIARCGCRFRAVRPRG
jgi:hypothetical protein